MSICELEQLLNLMSAPSFQIIANPPLLLSRGTLIPWVISNFLMKPFILLELALVSTRNTKIGFFYFSSSMRIRTTGGDPRPRQFQAKILISLAVLLCSRRLAAAASLPSLSVSFFLCVVCFALCFPSFLHYHILFKFLSGNRADSLATQLV